MFTKVERAVNRPFQARWTWIKILMQLRCLVNMALLRTLTAVESTQGGVVEQFDTGSNIR